MQDPLIGVTLGHFQIEKQIAEGGMGVIYQATHEVIGRTAAIKVLSKKYSSDRSMIKRLHLEAQAVNRIGHPNIVDIFDFGQTPDQREYFVMEYLPGKNLAEIQAQQGRLPWSLTAQILEQTLDALSAAHQLGIVHRDIKPENILVIDKDQGGLLVKVLDFGIAKSVGFTPETERLTQAGSVMGTPEYISPEQIKGREIDGRSDLYAVGVILYELVMGRRPFESERVIDLLMAHLKSPVPAMDEIPEELGVPKCVPAVVNKAMAKEPEQRFPDAPTFARALGLETSDLGAGEESTRPLPQIHWDSKSPAGERTTNVVIPDLSTRPSPGISGTEALGGVQGPTKGMNLPSEILGQGQRRSPLVWIIPVALLLLASAAIAFYFALRDPVPPVTKVTKKIKPPASKPAAPPVMDKDWLQSLYSQVQRVLHIGLQVPQEDARDQCVRGIGALGDDDALARLSTVLKEDPSIRIRSAAAVAIANLSDPRGVAILREVRVQSTPAMRVWIDEALMRLNEKDGRIGLRESLDSKDQAVRFQAALALGEAGDPAALPALKKIARNAATLDRQTVIAVLGTLASLGHKESYQALSEVKDQPDLIVKLGAAEAMARLGNEEALSSLQELLTAEDKSVRLVAAKVLASMGNYAGLELAQKAISDPKAQSRRLAAEALGNISDQAALGPLATALKDAEWLVKSAAAHAVARILAQMPSALIRRSQDWIKAALANRDWSVRHAAIGSTTEMDPELAVRLLAWAFVDSDARVRAEAVNSLRKLRTPRAVPLLTRALADESQVVRSSAAVALGGMPGQEAQKALHSAVRDPSPIVRVNAAGALLASGDTSYVEALQGAIRSPNPAVRRAAINALGGWKDPRSRKLLLSGLKDKAPAIRFAAAYQLALRKDRTGLPELRRSIGSGGKDEQQALRALAALGLKPTEELKTLSRSTNSEARKSAMASAHLLGPKRAIAVLKRGVRDKNLPVRLAAARSLARLAPKHKRAAQLLQLMRKDSNPAVRARAELGLARVQRRSDVLDIGQVKPVAPAPLPEVPALKPAPKALNKDEMKKLLIDDSYNQRRYKVQLIQASLARSQAKYKKALKHLKAAQRHKSNASVHYEFGLVYDKLARKQLSSTRRAHLKRALQHTARAEKYFEQCQRKASNKKLARLAKAKLKGVLLLNREIKKKLRKR